MGELSGNELNGVIGQTFHQVMPELRFSVHHRFRVLIGATRSTLDEIARNGERRSCECKKRNRCRKFVDENVNRFGDMLNVLGRQRRQAL